MLYYQASHTDSEDLPTKEVEEEKKEEAEEEPKEEPRGEVVSEPAPASSEMKSTEEEEEGTEELEDQEGKEEDNQDEEDGDACPGTSEENLLKMSESKKVTAANGWVQWGTGPWAQMPRCSG